MCDIYCKCIPLERVWVVRIINSLNMRSLRRHLNFLFACICLLSLALSFLLLFDSGQNKGWTKDNLPDPRKDPKACGTRREVQLVCDPDRVLGQEYRDLLVDSLESLAMDTISGCKNTTAITGYQLGVVVMRKMHSSYWTKKDHIARNFSKFLHQRWGLGHKGCDDGILLLVSLLDRQTYIYKTTNRLSFYHINLIRYEMQSLLRNGERPGLVVNIGVQKIHSSLKSGSRRYKLFKAMSILIIFVYHLFYWLMLDYLSFLLSMVLAIVVALILFYVLNFLYCRVYVSRHKTCLDKVRQIESACKSAKTIGRLDINSCPLCSEEFTPNCVAQVLACGHKHCKTCIKKCCKQGKLDKQDNSRCFICRGMISETPNQAALMRRELIQRLLSLQRLYPTVITRRLIKYWVSRDLRISLADLHRLKLLDSRLYVVIFPLLCLFFLVMLSGNSVFIFTFFGKVVGHVVFWLYS